MEQGKRTVYEELAIDIAIGDPSFSKQINIKSGICTGVKYIDIDGTKRDHGITLQVEEAGGDALTGKTDYRDYINTGGDYMGNYKPCRFDTRADILVTMLSESNIASTALKGKLVFRIEQPCSI